MVSSIHRISVAEQVATALREGIRSGVWVDFLPAEHELARRFCVGRYSVRAALARLARDGLIVIAKGKRTRIRPQPRKDPASAPPTVCVVAPSAPGAPTLIGHHVLLEVHAELAAQSIGWEEVLDARLDGRHPEPHLQQLAAGRRNVCWLLVSVSAAVQRWFEKAGVPVVVVGTCHAGVKIPSVDTDYRAIGWHAAGFMTQYGHRHVAMVLPQRPMPGDLACRDGFADYVTKRKCPMLVAEVPAGTSQSALQLKLDRIMTRRQRPTAILSLVARNTLSVLFYLQQRRLQVPQDVSLVSADTHILLEQGIPEITRYRISTKKQARRIVRLVQSLLTGHAVPAKPSLITPTFVIGSTLARQAGATNLPG